MELDTVVPFIERNVRPVVYGVDTMIPFIERNGRPVVYGA